MDDTLVLVVIESAEEPREGARLACAPAGSTIGRSPENTHCLPDPSVSRRHARIERHDGVWTIVDTGSAGGTQVNSVAIEPAIPAPITPGDDIRIGPWRLSVEGGARRYDSTLATLSTESAPATVYAPSRRLETLSACIEALARTSGERELALAALRSAMQGIGARRGAMLRPPGSGNGAPIIASLERDDSGWREIADGALRVPRSLVTTASTGRTAVIDQASAPVDIAVSIAEQAIHSAVCAPVRLDDRVVALMYVDARQGEAPIRDGASFVEDVAQVYSLALAYDARREMERRQASLRADIERARTLRAMLAPPERLDIGVYRVAHAMRAGAFVSGDLVDVMPLSNHRVGILFGDASGHGVGAAMLTALAQSYLNSEIGHHDRLADAVEHANRFIATRDTHGSFVSLWAGVLGTEGDVTFVDAGHGHWCVARSGGAIEKNQGASGPPLGVVDQETYPEATLRLDKGDRVVLYTDGVSETEEASGRQLGAEGVRRALVGSEGCDADVRRLLAMLDACPIGAHDDATVMSIERTG